MRQFWRTSPLSDKELELIQLVSDAHHRSSFRDNPSSVVVMCTAQGSSDFFKSLAAGLLTLGGQHGPILQTYDLLNHKSPEEMVGFQIQLKAKIPGWGCSFFKGGIDPDWVPAYEMLVNHFKFEKLPMITELIHKSGVDIYPNPSAITAATAITIQMPKELSPYLLVQARLDAWAEIFYHNNQ